MPRCSKCGAEHEILDPGFRRPEAYVQLPPDDRERHAKADDDLCRIALPREPVRHFVRCVLPVLVRELPEGVWWGLWAEVSETAFQRILELWSAPEQADEPPLEGVLANVVPNYPDTQGLPVRVQLTGPTSRPELCFVDDADHPFIAECRRGVDMHRAAEWNSWIAPDAGDL